MICTRMFPFWRWMGAPPPCLLAPWPLTRLDIWDNEDLKTRHNNNNNNNNAKHLPPGPVSLVVGGLAQNLHHLSERLEEQLAVPGEELDTVQNNLSKKREQRCVHVVCS